MILKVYVYRDTKVGAYRTPIFSTDEPEICAEQCARYIVSGDSDVKLKMRDLVLYHLGSFDDKTGEFIAIKPVLLLNCADYCEVKDEQSE